MPFEPGPFAVREPMPFGPRIVTPGTFANMGATLVSTLVAGDTVLGTQVHTLAGAAATDLDGPFNEEVAPAFDALGGLGLGEDDVEIADVAVVADETLTEIGGLVADLPAPDDETVPPEEPPPPPGWDQD